MFLNKIMFMQTKSLSNASLCKVAYNNDSNQPFPGINEQLKLSTFLVLYVGLIDYQTDCWQHTAGRTATSGTRIRP